jgi:hypothetical protein
MVKERRRNRLLIIAGVVTAGLVTAGPALAGNGPEPPPLPQPPAAAPVGTVAIPVVPPVIEPPVVVTHIEDGNIDVSVEVLGSDADAEPGDSLEEAVVSPESAPSITETTTEDEAEGSEETSAAAPGATNINVSVRVLSPGQDKGVTQTNSGEGDGAVRTGADPTSAKPVSAPVSEAPARDAEDSSKYHEGNSQYQSDDMGAEQAWNWVWYLSVDCMGNATSSSTESGSPSSLDWAWEWNWEWGCPDHAEDPATAAETADSHSSSGSNARNGPSKVSAQTTDTSSTAPAEPWNWTWNFDFCGQATTYATSAGTGTPLTWTWLWNWTWSCAAEALVATVPPSPAIDPQRPATGTAPTEPEPGSGRPDFPAYSLPGYHLPGASFAASSADWGRTVSLPFLPETPVEVGIEVVIPPVVLPPQTAPVLTVDVVTAPTITFAPTPPPAVPHRLPPLSSPRSYAPDPTGRRFVPAVDRAPRARPASRSRTHAARPHPAGDRRDPLAPLEGLRQHPAIGSSSASGPAASALLFGVAALSGFIVLVAPRVGRRIRVARELRPRSRDKSPLDHPG